MNHLARGLVIAASVIAAVVAAVAALALTNPRPPRRPPAGANLDEFRRYVDDWTESGAAPSMLVAVVQHGRIIDWHGSGELSPLNPVAPDLDTIYHWWSMTKPFTATAIMRLADRGSVDLDAPAARYLPWLPEYGRELAPATVRQLLSHSAGLPDNVPAVIGWTHTAEVRERDQTEFLRSVFGGYAAVKYRPGTEQRYSNVGYMLLGAVIEAATGRGYLDYLEQDVLRTAGMHHSAFRFDRIEGFDGRNAAAGSHLVWRMETPFLYAYYGRRLDRMLVYRTARRLWFTEIIPDSHPPTGLRGSARDLAGYASAMLASFHGREGLVSTPAARAMMSPQLPAAASALSLALEGKGSAEAGYGLGFKVQAYRGRRVAGHSGGGPGFNLGLWLLPDDDTALIVLSSDTRIRIEEVMEAFVDALASEGVVTGGGGQE